MLIAFLLSLVAFTPGRAQEGGDPSPPPVATDPPAVEWLQHVAVVRDDWGVPHVTGDSEAATWFGFGLAQAEDHWRAMLVHYLLARGEMARAFGDVESPLAVSLRRAGYAWATGIVTNTLTDHLVLLFRLPQEAEAQFAALPADQQAMLRAFATGVNLHLSRLGDARPAWARDIAGSDVLCMTRLVGFSRILEFIGRESTQWPQGASNIFAIDGANTATGRPMLWTDPHLDLTGLSQWYEAHLTSPSYDMRGATFFGMPMLVKGFTRHLAWGMTRNSPDLVDLYHERLPLLRQDRYLDPTAGEGGEYVPFEEEVAEIQVRQEDGSLAAEPVTLRYSRHGPVLPRMVTPTAGLRGAFAVKTGLLDVPGVLGQLLAMARAESLEAFEAALARQQIPLWNVMATARSGGTLCVYNCRCPNRRTVGGEYDFSRPLPGDTTDADWSGFLPQTDLPRLASPASGWMQACNSHPEWITDGEDPTADVPGWLCSQGLSGRARRARELLAQAVQAARDGAPATLDDLTRIGMDAHVAPAARWVPRILDAFADRPPPEGSTLGQAVEVLREWDFQARAGSVAAALFLIWYQTTTPDGRHDWGTDGDDPPDAGEDAHSPRHLRNTFRLTVYGFRAAFGRWDVPWGDIHRLQRGENTTVGVSGATGIAHTLRCFQGVRDRDDWRRQDVLFGSGFTLGVAFTGDDADPVRARSGVPFGASEDPASPHYTDQLERLTAHDRLKPAWLLPRHIAAVTTSFEGGLPVTVRLDADTPGVRLIPAPLSSVRVARSDGPSCTLTVESGRLHVEPEPGSALLPEGTALTLAAGDSLQLPWE